MNKKSAGRPEGTPNKGIEFLKNEKLTQRLVTRGFIECMRELKKTCGYKSEVDVMMDAMDILANRKLPDSFYWRGKIQ